MKKTSMNFVVVACITICGYLFLHAISLLIKTPHKDVVIIDKSLENYQELASQSENSSLVILVENTDNGLSALVDKLNALTGIERLHILTHGSNGSFILGGQQLEEQNVGKFGSFWKAVSNSFASEKSELLIYSCQLASGSSGKSFVEKLHNLLAVSVAGSVDNTGFSPRGGNWDLEYVAGNVMKDHVLKYLDFKGLLIPQFSMLTGTDSPFNAIKIHMDNQLIYGDFDSDGDIDIHSYDGTSATNDFWQNNGTGSFTKVTGAASPFQSVDINAVFYSADKAFVADWDNDGDADIYVTMRSTAKSEKNFFYRNDNGKYKLLSGVDSPFANVVVSGYTQLIYGDFDSDGDVDLHNYPGSRPDNPDIPLDSEFWRNNGSGVFTKITGTQNPFNSLAGKAAFSSAEYTYVADWDNDGDIDILTTQRGNIAVRDYYQNNNGVYSLQTGSGNPFNGMAIASNNQILFGDFDADGDIDLHTSNGSVPLIFWRNNGSGVFTQVTGAGNPFNSLINAGAFYKNAKKAYVADWDNDKDVDIFTAYYDDGKKNYFFRQTDAPPLITATIPANQATGVLASGNISFTFSRAVSGVANKNIQIRRLDNNNIVATIAANSQQVTGNGTNTITVNPTSDLNDATGYYVTIDKAAFADSDGRIFTGISSNATLRFTTGVTLTEATVTTTSASEITQTTARLGGSVTADGNTPVTDRGIVWSTSPTPTISSNKVQIDAGTGTFTKIVTGLPTASRIYVRAYATNSVGTAYGNEIDFYTTTSVSSIVNVNASPTNSSQVAYTVTFANSVTGVDAADFALTTSGVSGAFISGVSGSGRSYTVSINTGSGNGSIRLDFTGTSGTQPQVTNTFTTAVLYDIYKVSAASNYYRTRVSSANWDQSSSWESSADNSFWIQATNFPDALGSTATVSAGQTISLPSGFDAKVTNLTNNGIIHLNANALTIANSFANAGTLKGAGTFVNGNFSNSGTIVPGNSAGTLSFTGNLANSGTVNMEIGGTVAGTGYDQIKVTGSILLSGILNVTLINGYTPVLGNEFTIIDAASLTGTFTTLNLPVIAPRIWETTYDKVNGTLKLKVVNNQLPVTLISFKAVREEVIAKLSWITSQETNSSHFDVERSSTGNGWEKIGIVNALTNSSSHKEYQYSDMEPAPGENLYRLKMTDLDGTFAYSIVRAVNFGEQEVEISSYPNPVSDRLLIKMKDIRNINGLTIYNSSGIAVGSFDKYQANGIQVTILPAGLYILKIKTVDGRSILNKFMKH